MKICFRITTLRQVSAWLRTVILVDSDADTTVSSECYDTHCRPSTVKHTLALSFPASCNALLQRIHAFHTVELISLVLPGQPTSGIFPLGSLLIVSAIEESTNWQPSTATFNELKELKLLALCIGLRRLG